MSKNEFMELLKKGINQKDMSLDEFLNMNLFDKTPYNLVFKKENIGDSDE